MRALCLTLLLLGCSTPRSTPDPAPADQALPAAQVEPEAEAAPEADPVLQAPEAVERQPASEERGPLAAGEPCLQSSECASGVCEGQGCTDEEPGVCAEEPRPCTRDHRAYCGCDGQTFFSSSSCVGQRYAHPGTC